MTKVNNQFNDIDKIIETLKNIIGKQDASLHRPYFHGKEWDYLKNCLDSSYVSSVGCFVDKFERELAEYTGSKYAIALVNGTSALFTALKASGVKSGDEVLVPSLSFIATANAVSHCGASPLFVDSDMETLGVDPESLNKFLQKNTKIKNNLCINKQTGKVIRALVPMHVFGHPVKIIDLVELAEKYRLILIEDAAEALGSKYDGRHVGTFGLMGVLSFNGNKIITTGGGGAVLTNDEKCAKYIKHITTTAKIPHQWRYSHDEVGYNFRMPNINAALGCAQLEKLDEFVGMKRKLYSVYHQALNEVKGFEMFQEPDGCKSNYWLQAVLLEEEDLVLRDYFLNETNRLGVSTRPVWDLLHLQKPYRNCQSMDLNIAISLSKRIINLPSNIQV